MKPKTAPRSASKAKVSARPTTVAGKAKSAPKAFAKLALGKSRAPAPKRAVDTTAALERLTDEIRRLRLLLLSHSGVLESLLRPGGCAANATLVPESRATQELEALNERLGVPEDDFGREFPGGDLERGSEAAKAAWVKEGRLIGSNELGAAWGRTRQSLERARDRGELFNVKIANRRWYPAVFDKLDAEQVKAVCQVLSTLDPVDQFIFWERKHGSLGGRTLPEVLRSGQLKAAVGAAEAFAREQWGGSCFGRLTPGPSTPSSRRLRSR